jgi:hypothetical protein
LQYQRKVSAQEDAARLEGSNNRWIRLAHKISDAKQFGYLPESFAPLEKSLEQINAFRQTTDAVSRSVREEIIPAGSFHMAMSFGPLIFESSVKR